MPKLPKAPGANGSLTTPDLISMTLGAADALQSGWSYHKAEVMAGVLVPLVRLGGEEHAPDFLAHARGCAWHEARGRALLGAGRAAAGDRAGAQAAVRQAEALINKHALDGEVATIAWGAVAVAHHACGDEAAADASLDEADKAARREKFNPSQPWPYLARALADTGRLDRLLALVRATRPIYISFAFEDAVRDAVALAAERGDWEVLDGFIQVLHKEKGYVLASGLEQATPALLRAGKGDALPRVLSLFKVSSYADRVGISMGLRAIEAGQVELARGLAVYVRDEVSNSPAEVAEVFMALGDEAEAKRLLEAQTIDQWRARAMARVAARMGDVALVMQYVDAIGLHDEARGSTLAEGVELVGRRGDAGLKEAMMDAVLSDIARMPEPARAQALARVGRALLGLGEAERAAKLFDEALAVADGISRPKSDQGWTRNNCLQTLGHMWAEADVWSHGLQALKKCTSKHFKPGIATRLSYSYARQGDLAGARVLLSHVPGNHIKSVMSACDLLYLLAGMPTPYTSHS